LQGRDLGGRKGSKGTVKGKSYSKNPGEERHGAQARAGRESTASIGMGDLLRHTTFNEEKDL